MVFVPLGFESALEPLPTISTPLFALDMTAPLSQFFQANGKTTPVTAYGQALGSALDQVSGGGWWDAGTPTISNPLNANVQFGKPGFKNARVDTSALYCQTANQDSASRILTWQGTSPTPHAFTIFCVAQILTAPTSGQIYRFIGAAKDANTDPNIAGCTSLYCTPTAFTFVRNAAAATNACTVSLAPVNGKLYKMVARFTNFSTAMKLAINEIAEASFTPSGSMETFVWDTSCCCSGDYSSTFQDIADCYMLEARVWGAACTDAQRSALLNYATKKWGT